MKLWIIPWPYDDDEAAKLIIMAASMADALAEGKKWFATQRVSYRKPSEPQWDKIAEHASSLYEDTGCSE